MKISFTGYLWRYGFYFVVTASAIYGLLSLVERFLPQVAAWFYGSGASTGLNVAALMLPGIYLGQKWVRTEGVAMPRGIGWGLALCCAVIAMLLSAVLAVVMLWGDAAGQAMWADVRREMGLFWGVAAAMFVFVILITRLAIWTAVRGELKRLARLEKG